MNCLSPAQVPSNVLLRESLLEKSRAWFDQGVGLVKKNSAQQSKRGNLNQFHGKDLNSTDLCQAYGVSVD